MISELTIINLQVFSAILMGYEFFISEKIKISVDLWAKSHATGLRDSSFKDIKKQTGIIKKHIPYYVSRIVLVVLGMIFLKLISVYESQLDLTSVLEYEIYKIWLFVICALLTMLFVWGTFFTVLGKLIMEGLAPVIIPLSQWVLTLYLLFTSKGVISGVGFIFLIASFGCRYHNAIYV